MYSSPNKWKHNTGGRTYGVVVFGGKGFVPSFILLKHGLNFASNMNALSVYIRRNMFQAFSRHSTCKIYLKFINYNNYNSCLVQIMLIVFTCGIHKPNIIAENP